VESLCSALGVAEFGHVFSHEELCEAIARFSSAPGDDLLEYLGRDVLNLALANSDNHARNTAFLKEGPLVRLSPIFDVAPMELDPEGIPRAARWAGENHLRPDWGRVADFLSRWLERDRVVASLRAWASQVRDLPRRSAHRGLPTLVLDRCAPRWERLAHDLEVVS